MLANFPLSFSTPEVAFFEVFDVGRMDGPIVALTVGAPSGLDEAVVERQVVSDGVPPSGST
jgi:hypothetical protein